jgi:hypothetical protein
VQREQRGRTGRKRDNEDWTEMACPQLEGKEEFIKMFLPYLKFISDIPCLFVCLFETGSH